MITTATIFEKRFACALALGLWCAVAGGIRADVVGKAQTRTDFDSFRVRRVGMQVKGAADNPDIAIPEQALLPLDVILQIRRKRYEVIGKPSPDYPVAGIVGVNYEVSRKAKDEGQTSSRTSSTQGKAKFEITLKGRVSLRTTQKEVVLWYVDSSTTQVAEGSERLAPDLIQKLVTGFYKGVFDTLPKVPTFRMVVGAPYKFPDLLTREPMRPPRDVISVGRIMRGVLKERWEGAPVPLHRVEEGGGDPVVQIWNDSDQQLTVCYQGVTDVDLILAPNAKMAFRVVAGSYKIAARTADDAIVPLCGSENLLLSKTYSIRFSVSEEGY